MIKKVDLENGKDAFAIFDRLLTDDRSKMSPTVARQLLKLRLSEEDERRMHVLLERNQEGAMSHDEREELQSYAQAGCWLGILHSKARRTLGKALRIKASEAP